MEFHIARRVREELDLGEVLFSYTGNVVFADVNAARKLAQRLTAARAAKRNTSGADPLPEDVVNAGALYAMGLIDELSHAIIARYRRETDPEVLTEALRFLAQKSTPADVEKLLRTFATQFPNTEIFNGKVTVEQWLAASTEDLSNREAAMEELLLLWLANINPAFIPFRDLFGDTDLREQTIYKAGTEALPQYFKTRPPVDAELGTLLDALCAPMLASPESLSGQLDFIREMWAPLLGEELRHILLAIDVLREEDIAIWMRFNPPSPDKYLHGDPRFEAHGFSGDEYIGFEEEWVTNADGVRVRRRYATDHQAPLNEYEAFSADDAWMPNVVLLAKSTYVWLEQLSKKHGRHIHRLDQIPEEDLAEMADRGITGLWLIGLWERSIASKTIKHLRGHADAVASAYSLKEYRIAEDLGGNEAYERLRDRASRFGLRLASDMVPNHMGIDSTWVIENPDWFLTRPEPPFPAYTYNGPDLSADSRVEIKIEDHYYDQTDAAVAFRLRHHRDGSTRYMYHGNDGTTFAWNDTAQLDYSKAAVREHVIQTILQVARQFPIIRFDAAMTLAKRHVQRLWFPLPGVGGSIPSRAEDAVSQEHFDSLMPHEFWREVVDRVAVEVPGTLLLAEAFWMLEGYFVRTLGMHRVYNSAFMNMLRDEENAKYRSYLKKTIEFDPDILKRYVNFMSNPDERTAIDQFGSGDKCFGVATLMCTLPGLPMFGHGQIEGYTERYGMEFKRAKMEEWPDAGLVARHQHEIAPLLKRRWAFAESTHFALYDFWNNSGAVDENVFAYSNRSGDAPSLVVYNNAYESTEGTLHYSAESMDKGSGTMRSRSLSEALALSGAHDVVLAYQDHARGLQYLVRASHLATNGFHIALRGYQYAVLLHWRELRSSATHPWDALCDALNGAGVRNLDEALARLRLRPLHEALRSLISTSNLELFAKAPKVETEQNPAAQSAIATASLESFETAALRFFELAQEETAFEVSAELEPAAPDAKSQDATKASPVTGTTLSRQQFITSLKQHLSSIHTLAARAIEFKSEAAASMLPGKNNLRAWGPVLAYVLLRSLPTNSPAALFDDLHLRANLAEIFAELGFEGDDAWRAAARTRLLLAYPGGIAKTFAQESFWADPDARWLAGVNEADGISYLNREKFEELAYWMLLPQLLATEPPGTLQAAASKVLNIAATAGYKLHAFTTPVAQKPAPALETAAAVPAVVKAATKVARTKAVSKTPKAPAKISKPAKQADSAKQLDQAKQATQQQHLPPAPSALAKGEPVAKKVETKAPATPPAARARKKTPTSKS